MTTEVRAGNISIDELRDYFECPICLTPPSRPPIYQCLKGHLICSDCRPQITLCPICRTKLSNSRLLFAERLMEDRLPVSCKYSVDGCQEQRVMAKLKEHEERCPLRPVRCPNAASGCRHRPRAASASSHATVECRYKSVPCPVSQCLEAVVEAKLEAHLRTVHFGRKGRAWFAPDNERMAAAFVAVLALSVAMNAFFLFFYL